MSDIRHSDRSWAGIGNSPIGPSSLGTGLVWQAEQQFLVGAGTLMGAVNHLAGEERSQITIETISTEAVTTAEIEGEILDRASVQSSIRRQFGLATDNRRVGPAEQGMAEMMVDLYRSFAVPLVHFEAPPSSQVESEMERFIAWFNRTGPGNAEPLPALTRAGMVHLYFECIHPLEDGNGRIGRALAEKSMAQSLGQPTLTALAATILAKRKSYYEALEAANKQNEITAWLAWFAGVAIEAQRRSTALRRVLDRQDKAA